MASLAVFTSPRVLRGLVIGGSLVVVGAFAYVVGTHNLVLPEAPPAAASNDPPQIGSMTLEAQFKGPLQDTLIQRLRDPATGAVCYLYLPVRVQHSQPMEDGVVLYGANTVGSISCLPR